MCLYVQDLGSISSMKGGGGRRKKGKGEVEGGREKICKYKSEVVIHICNSNNQLIWKDWELKGSMDYI